MLWDRWFSRVLLGSATFALCQIALAQDFPSRPIKLLIGYPPGGVPDTVGRAIAPVMQSLLGQPFIVENRPGAGGLTAVQEVLRSPADGYTLLSADSAQWAILPALRPGTYDPEKAFAPVAMVTTNSVYITVRSSLGVKSLQEFIALMKSKPGAFSYGSSGNGSVHHLFMESFKAAAGLDIQHVPYKGSVQQVQALLAGDIPIGIAGGTATAAYVKSGQMRLLLTSTRERSKLTPDVPSMGDISLPELDFAGSVGYLAPAGTPRSAIERLTAAIAKAVHQPELMQRFESVGVESFYKTPEQYAEIIRADVPRYVKAVKISGAKVD